MTSFLFPWSPKLFQKGSTLNGKNFLKGRFLEFQMYHYFTNLFSKLSESAFYKEIRKFQ